MYIKMLIFADSLFVESVTVKFRKYGEISVPVVFCFYSADVEKVKANPKRSLSIPMWRRLPPVRFQDIRPYILFSTRK